jgi:D-glycero-D-manno-heptose 1,7-bisphosphate phosphatase
VNSLVKRDAVFLDRDGVINLYVYNAEFGTVDSPSSPDEFTLAPGAGNAIAEFNRLGLLVVVVSNQPGIAKGKFTSALLDRVTTKMHDGVAASGGKLDGVYYCLHHPEAVVPQYRAHCVCRKPHPGLLLQAARELGIQLQTSYMIGDGISDIEAGRAAGTRTIFIGQAKPYILDALEKRGIQPDFMAPTLADAAESIKRQMAAIRNGQMLEEPDGERPNRNSVSDQS